MKKYIIPFVFLFSFTLSACDNIINANNSDELYAVTATENPSDTIKTGKVRIIIDGKAFIFRLAESKTASALLKTLPFETSASVYHGNHYYGSTPVVLSVDGIAMQKEAKKGQLVYSAEYQSSVCSLKTENSTTMSLC